MKWTCTDYNFGDYTIKTKYMDKTYYILVKYNNEIIKEYVYQWFHCFARRTLYQLLKQFRFLRDVEYKLLGRNITL